MPKHLVDLRDQRPLLDIVSYGRRGPGNGHTFTFAERDCISRTVRGVPEVMIKVSGGGTSVGAVAAHFRYIDRRGGLEIETDDGERRQGAGIERDLLEDWDLPLEEQDAKYAYTGAPGRRPTKLVHNIVFSMPRGTPPEKLLRAVSHFAQEKFALQHRYAMVLHTDHDHPHVHLVMKAVSEQGKRLNIRKAMLREWRRDFAQALRAKGVAANATERGVRGETRTHKTDGIYRAMRRGDSTHFEERTRAVAGAMLGRSLQAEPGRAKLLETRHRIEQGWTSVSKLLERDGDQALALRVRHFLHQMHPVRTERELIAEQLRARLRHDHDLQKPLSR